MSDMVYCRIVVKKEAVPWQKMRSLSYADRNAKSKEIEEKFRKDFYKVLNEVVEYGGVFCHTKTHFDSDYRMYDPNIKIKIPKEKIDTMNKNPLVESIVIL